MYSSSDTRGEAAEAAEEAAEAAAEAVAACSLSLMETSLAHAGVRALVARHAPCQLLQTAEAISSSGNGWEGERVEQP